MSENPWLKAEKSDKPSRRTQSNKSKNSKNIAKLPDGISLEHVLKTLLKHYTWNELGERVDIRCFKNDPSIKSSLKFLRKTPWARIEVEQLFLAL